MADGGVGDGSGAAEGSAEEYAESDVSEGQPTDQLGHPPVRVTAV